jgi:S1-C subfamily serine protease
MSRARLAVLVALGALLMLAGCGFGGGDDGGGDRPASTTRVEVIRSKGQSGGFDPQAIYKEEAPGVVTVMSQFGSNTPDDAGGSGTGVGSGFVLNESGEIATNAHVVTTGDVPDLHKARAVYVEFADGNKVEASIKGYDPEADVALLKVDPDGLTRRSNRCRSASCRPSIAPSRGLPHSRSAARSRPTRRSIRATPAARWSTGMAR